MGEVEMSMSKEYRVRIEDKIAEVKGQDARTLKPGFHA